MLTLFAANFFGEGVEKSTNEYRAGHHVPRLDFCHQKRPLLAAAAVLGQA